MELGFLLLGLGGLFGLCLLSLPKKMGCQTDEKDDIVVIDRSAEYDGRYDDIP